MDIGAMWGRFKTRVGVGLGIGALAFGVLGLLALLPLSQFPYRLSHSEGINFKTIYCLTIAFFVGGLLCGLAALWLAHFSPSNSKWPNFSYAGAWVGICVSVVAVAALRVDIGNWGIHSTPSALNICLNHLRKIDKAKEEWVLRSGATNGTEVLWDNIKAGFSDGFPVCPEGGKYNLGKVGEPVTCSNPHHRVSTR